MAKAKGATTEAIDTACLDSRHERFCREYIHNGGNGTRAYMKVYPAAAYNSARALASELLTNLNILERIKELRTEREKRLDVSGDKIIRELAKLAFFNSQDLYDDDGRVKPIHELDRDTAAAITSIEVVERVTGDGDTGALEFTRKIRMADKKAALELLGKNQGLWETKQAPPDEGGINAVCRAFAEAMAQPKTA